MIKWKCSEWCTLEMIGQDVTSQTDAKYLGVWWRWDLSPEKSVNKWIHKARHAFFALGSIGAFHGWLNPLTGRRIFFIFVVPTMLYGCETWILFETHIRMLKSFQTEIWKCISKYHSNTSTLIGPSVKARVYITSKANLSGEGAGERWRPKLTYVQNSCLRRCLHCQSCPAILLPGAIYWNKLSATVSQKSHWCLLNSTWCLQPEKKSGEKIGFILYRNPKHTGLFQLSPPRILLRQVETAYRTKHWISVSGAQGSNNTNIRRSNMASL